MGPAPSIDERESSVGGVEAVGAADDEADLVVQPFVSAVGQSVLDGVEDELAPEADGLGGLDERGLAGTLRGVAPSVEGSGPAVRSPVTGSNVGIEARQT